ncbi:MAG: PAS domain S-box protein [Phycisphaerales bacterium]|nr:MAG: PAS domain S-box protein [Phycisphaerales bacterium]
MTLDVQSPPQLVEQLNQLRPHDHLCLIYETQEQQFAAAIPFISAGLSSSQKCIYIADDNTCDIVLGALQDYGIDVPAALHSGSLQVVSKQDSYLKQGGFDPDWMINFLGEGCDDAKAHDFSGLRVTGEMTWALGGDQGTDRLIEYEAKLNDFLPANDVLAICQYNLRRFSPELILQVIRTHPLVVFGSRVCRNAYYVPPAECLGPASARDEVTRLLHNITEHERLTQELRSSETRYRALVEQIPAITYIAGMDRSSTKFFVSPQVEELLGHSPTDFQADPDLWCQRLHPDDRERVLREVQHAHAANGRLSTEYRMITSNGGEVWFRDDAVVICDDSDRPLVLQGVMFDITERKRVENALRESDEKFREMADNIREGFWLTDPKSAKILYLSPGFCAIWGRSLKELSERPDSWIQSVHADDREAVLASFEEQAKGAATCTEFRVTRPDGSCRWIENRAFPVRDKHGDIYRMAGVAEDITVRKQAEQALQETSRRLSRAQHVARMGFLDWNLKTNEMYWSDQIYDLFGIAKQGHQVSLDLTLGLAHPDDLEFVEKNLDLAIKGVRPYDIDHRMIRSDGEVIWVHAQAELTREADGKPGSLLGTVVDITDRKRAEEALRKERDFADGLIETAQTIIMVLDTEGRIVRFNPFMEQVSGYRLEEVKGKCWFSTFVPSEDHESIRAVFKEAINDVQTRGNINPILTKDGRQILVEWYDKTLKDSQGNIVGLLSVGQDITERTRAEEKLRASEEKHRRLIEHLPQKIFHKNANGVYVSCNDNYAQDLGIAADEIRGKTDFDFYPKDLAEKYRVDDRRIMESGRKEEIEEAYVEHGRELVVQTVKTPLTDDNGDVTGVLGIFWDITERKRAETELAEYRDRLEELVDERSKELEESRAQLHRAQRLASIGTLAAGIAHEINNPLGVILLSAQRALEKGDDPKAVETSLHRIKDDVQRCARIVRSVLQFSRDQSSDKWPVDLNQCVRHSEELTREYASRNGVRVQFECAGDLPVVVASTTELEQAFVNLLHNAIEASSDGQTVTLQTERSPTGVRFSVADQGRGMTAEEQEHAFDPFFTTRQERGGTGLGLSIVHGLITDQGGTIEIDSHPGKGTRVTIELPVEASNSSEE